MKPMLNISWSNKTGRTNLVLGLVLPLIAIAVTYLIVEQGNKAGALVIMGIVGVGILMSSVYYPEFGFYTAIIFSFFLFDIQRFLRSDLPLGTFVDVLIYLVFIGIIIRKTLDKEPFWKNCYHPIVFVYIIVVIFSVIQIFNPLGAPFGVTFLIYRRFLSLMIFLYCAIQLFKDEEAIYRFLKIYLVFAIIAALYGCYQQWFGYPAYELSFIQSNPRGEQLLSMGNGTYRKFSFLASPADYGLLMAAVALVFLALLLNMKGKWKQRLIFATGLILSLLAMSYSGTRTATMMFVLGVILYIMMTLNNIRTMVFTALFGLGFIFLLYGPIYGNGTVNRLRSTFDLSEDESYKVRDDNRNSIQPFIYSHPLGGGLGTSGVGSSAVVPGHPLADFPSDSGLLRNAVEYGWLGLVVLYITYIVGLYQGIRAYYRSRNPRNKILFLGAVVAIFGYIVAQYAQVAIGMIPGAFFFYGLMAIIVRLRQIDVAAEKQNQ